MNQLVRKNVEKPDLRVVGAIEEIVVIATEEQGRRVLELYREVRQNVALNRVRIDVGWERSRLRPIALRTLDLTQVRVVVQQFVLDFGYELQIHRLRPATNELQI